MSYRWVPAHAVPQYNDVHLYVTYEKNKVNSPTPSGEEPTTQGGFGRSIIKCPDRTLIITYDNKYRPLNTSFDKCISFTMFNKNSIFNDIGIGLISADIGMKLKDKISIPNNHTLIGDSGGFQLRIGTTDFIDPYMMVNWFNTQNVDIGASLDLVPRGGYTEFDSEYRACVKAQKLNNRIFLSYRRPDLKIMNVLHGSFPEHQRIWAENVNDDRIECWAVGSESSIINAYHGILYLREKFERDHYHIFGLGATKNVFILSWIGKHVPLLTSDTTTYRNGGMSREIQLLDPNGIVKMLHVGRIKEYKENIAHHIPCNCPICSEIKYIDVFGLASKYKTERLLIWHNMLSLHRQAKYWNEIALKSSYEEYINSIHTSLGSNKTNFLKIRKMLEFVNMCIEGNRKEAIKKHNKQFKIISNIKLLDSNIEDFIIEKKEKEGKRTLKSKKTSDLVFPVSIDTLPKYIPKKILENKLDLVIEDIFEEEGIKRYKDKEKRDRSKILKEKGTLESIDKKYIRKLPYFLRKQFRKFQLQKG